jgi:isopenicillin N synthase-like dioxygenase
LRCDIDLSPKPLQSATDVTGIPIIDLTTGNVKIAAQIHSACRQHGFFCIVGHGVDEELIVRLHTLSKQFFKLPEATKARYAMPLAGRAWRGWFPLGGEITSGQADCKEGLYIGQDLDDDHPMVQSGAPLHGKNLLPDDNVVAGFRNTIDEYMAHVTQLGHRVLELLALSLGLATDFFLQRYTADPLLLFRIFHYPTTTAPPDGSLRFGVGEHTDYGLVTLLHQDDVGGLEVKSGSTWIDVPPVPNSFVCNIGDMLDRMTAGYYRSTPHRVRINTSGRDRLSLPLFFDPNFNARIEPIRTVEIDDAATRWDQRSVHAFEGSYGDYLVAKVSRVFPDLKHKL